MRVEDLQTDQMRVGSNPGPRAVAVVTVAGYRPRDVCSVTVVVIWSGVIVDEVDESRHALATDRAHQW